jgi:hypothetical protein
MQNLGEIFLFRDIESNPIDISSGDMVDEDFLR